MHRLYRFTQPVRGRKVSGRRSPERPRIGRDGDGYTELQPVFARLGYTFEEQRFNYASPDWEAPAPKLGQGDALVWIGRAAFEEVKLGGADKKHDEETGQPLERAGFVLVKQHLRCDTRSVHAFREHLARELAEPRAEVHFYQNRPYAPYRACYELGESGRRRRVEPVPRATAAFLIIDRLPGGALFYNVWGASSEVTTLWCHLLRTRFPHLMESPRVAMAEIELPESAPERPESLDFARTWGVRILLDHPLEPLAQRTRERPQPMRRRASAYPSISMRGRGKREPPGERTSSSR